MVIQYIPPRHWACLLHEKVLKRPYSITKHNQGSVIIQTHSLFDEGKCKVSFLAVQFLKR